jgi:lipoprotein-releasing system ATP-binding protein
MADPVLHLEGVRRVFGTKVLTEVLRGIDLELVPGEFAALVGPSGSGKSTLLNLMGLLDRPTSGRIFVQGQETSKLDDTALTILRGRKLGFVFQYHHLLPAFTAVENVMMPLMADKGGEKAGMREHALQLLDRVGLTEKAKVRASDLSGGQQQRVAIARALSSNPPLVLADEPTGNLDTQSSDACFQLLREFNREQGTAFLIVTHDERLAARCDRVIEIVDGLICSDRPTAGKH